MSDKLTDEQLITIRTVTRTDDVASRHVRMMAAELLEIRKKRLLPAELIAQCEQDKIDYPEFWWELWQFRAENEWKNFKGLRAVFFDGDLYRKHPHRKSIIEFNGCSDDVIIKNHVLKLVATSRNLAKKQDKTVTECLQLIVLSKAIDDAIESAANEMFFQFWAECNSQQAALDLANNWETEKEYVIKQIFDGIENYFKAILIMA